MSAFNRKRQASPPDQVNQAKRWAQDGLQTCCNCSSNPFALFQLNTSINRCCTGCGHFLCEKCPVIGRSLDIHNTNPQDNVHEERNRSLTRSASFHSAPIQQKTQGVNEEDEGGHLGAIGHRPSHEKEYDTGQHPDERQAQELQPQPTEEQQQVETGGPSKRSLTMKKCERCRVDKKKCLPVNRVWPTKCGLCIKKGFPCSEGKRVLRSTKHAPASSPSSANVAFLATTSVSFEERLKQWTFLSSYQRMMNLARNRLKELEKDMISSFPYMNFGFRSPEAYSYFCFTDFNVKHLEPALRRCTQELLAVDLALQKLPGWFFPASLSLPMFSFGAELGLSTVAEFACSECYPAHSQSITDGFKSSRDACGELSVLQHHAIVHGNIENWEVRHTGLSLEVSKRASTIFASFGWSEAASYSSYVGVYHPTIICLKDPDDCLGRSQLHLYMDSAVDYCDRSSCFGEPFEFEGNLSKLKDRKDILGRTALLMACHENWEEAVERLLEEQANPGIATIYGTLPLHHAAANGSVVICEQLLAHRTKFDVAAKDCMRMTALGWATKKKHKDVVDLLSTEYLGAGLHEELLEHAVSKQLGSDPPAD